MSVIKNPSQLGSEGAVGLNAQQYYRLQELFMVRFSPEEDTDLNSLDNSDTNNTTENSRSVIRRIRSETPDNAEVPFYMWLIDVVKNLWLRTRRLFYDLWC